MKKFNFCAALFVIVVVGYPRLLGQAYCEDAGSTGPKEYPEMASKCTLVRQGVTRTTISARFLGPQLRANKSDPVCSYPAKTVTCRRLCGDLPEGKTPGAVVEKGILPPSFARFEDNLETFPKGDHWRVCMRVKNWANGGLNKGEYRTFRYSLDYGP
jgi:hypothetical protein